MLKSNETKPGLLTTEFWAAVVLPWLVTLGDNQGIINVVPERYRFLLPVISMIVSGFYAVGRGKAKQGVPYQPTP